MMRRIKIRHILSRICTLTLSIALISCGGEGTPDTALNGLVVSTNKSPVRLDLTRLTTDISEFTRSLSLRHSYVSKQIGAHTFLGRSRIELHQGDKEVAVLADETGIVLDKAGNYQASLKNSHDYGREAYFVDGTMYLRPRYGKFHRRPPTSTHEPTQVREEIFATLDAYWGLLAAGAAIEKVTTTTFSGRDAKLVTLGKATEPRKRPIEEDTSREWRNTIVVSNLAGEATLDNTTGIVLAADITGTITYTQEDKPFRMTIHIMHKLADFGQTPTVVAPAPEQTVSAYQYQREFKDRNTLLRGLTTANLKKQGTAAQSSTKGTTKSTTKTKVNHEPK